jgi:hypothetical protein
LRLESEVTGPSQRRDDGTAAPQTDPIASDPQDGTAVSGPQPDTGNVRRRRDGLRQTAEKAVSFTERIGLAIVAVILLLVMLATGSSSR